MPVILGVRCINREGAGYASPVMIQPCPGIENAHSDCLYGRKQLDNRCAFPTCPHLPLGMLPRTWLVPLGSSLSLTARRKLLDKKL